MTLRRSVIGFVALSCLFLLVEVVIEHREVFGEKPIAWAPVVVCLLGLVTSTFAFARWSLTSMRALQIASSLLLIVGLVGLFFHNSHRLGLGEGEAEVREAEHQHPESHEGEHEEHQPPPLAPLALSGIGFLGLTATYQQWRKEE